MIVQVINKATFREMPWANGGGVTKELFAHNDEHTGRVLWRISMASVNSDGPFSHFDGYDRVLVLLKGQGLKLSHRDGTEHELSTAYELATFPGDIETHATLINGPVQDFNVIVDRCAFGSSVAVLPSGNNCSVPVNTGVLVIYAIDDVLRIVDPSSANHSVQQGDLLLVDAPQPGEWFLSGATSIVIQLCPVS